MDYGQLLRFLDLAHRKLKPSGIFVAETVNMHSLAAAKCFWVDPTHVTPIFPEVAVALARLHGFGAARIVFPNGTGEFDRDRYEQGEYALIAERGEQG
jgi:O-antigen chain-terminating methyltransferase